MDKAFAHRLVTEVFNFLESRTNRPLVLMALGIVEQMAHAAIDQGLLDFLKQRGALQMPEPMWEQPEGQGKEPRGFFGGSQNPQKPESVFPRTEV